MEEGATDPSGSPILADIGQWFVKQVRDRCLRHERLGASPLWFWVLVARDGV